MPSHTTVQITANPHSSMVASKTDTSSIDALLPHKLATSKDEFGFLSNPSFEEDHVSLFCDTSPILSRPYHYENQSHMLTASHESLLPISTGDNLQPSSANSSFGENVGHAASETYLITRLSLHLLRYLGVGYRWITKFLALGCYTVLLMPGFIQVGWYYFSSSTVKRSIVYGDEPRNRLDLYIPKDIGGPKPVVVFVTGGAWIIGYKAWGSLLGRQLSERDIVVACLDYRNFPQGTISHMVKDVSEGISFVCNHIADYGGDPNRIYLMGQSAGAHISSCALVEQAIKEAGRHEGVTWSVSQIKSYIGLSGGYNLLSLVDHFNNRGLYRSLFLSIMEGEQSLHRYSPEILVQDPSVRNAISLLPPTFLFHGTADKSIPSDASQSFAASLKSVDVKAESILYEGKSHTDLFLQDPLRGGKNEIFESVVDIVYGDDEQAREKNAVAPPFRRRVPEFMLKLAHTVSPF